MNRWRAEYDDGIWRFYRDGMELGLYEKGDVVVDALNVAESRIAELEEENNRLQDAWFRDETICPDGSLKPKVSTLLNRIAELEGLVRELLAEGEYLSMLSGLVDNDSDWKQLVDKANKTLPEVQE